MRKNAVGGFEWRIVRHGRFLCSQYSLKESKIKVELTNNYSPK